MYVLFLVHKPYIFNIVVPAIFLSNRELPRCLDLSVWLFLSAVV